MASHPPTPDFLRRDLAVNWHPLTSYARQLSGEVVEVCGASGDRLWLADGRHLIDGISCWWCKLLGYQHPRLRRALVRQAGILEHSIYANTASEPLLRLSEMLCERVAGAARVIYAGDGSSVVDAAAKLSLFVQQRRGQPGRRRFVCLQNAYHGESVGAMSLSDVAKYTDGFSDLCFASHRLEGVPYVDGRAHPRWRDAADAFGSCLGQLQAVEDELAAVIVEPLLQGAGGMKVYSADFLARLCAWARERGILVIADEIMTGMGRLGAWTACSIANCSADITLLSKSLTAGWTPFSALLCTEEISGLALIEADAPFAHSHTYMGHPLGAAVACEVIDVIESEGILERVQGLEGQLRERLERVGRQTGALHGIRSLGAVAAAEIADHISEAQIARLAGALLRRGLLLRPLGRCLYWMPAATVSERTLAEMEEITAEGLDEIG